MNYEIDGWIIKRNKNGEILFNNPINPIDFYMITLIKNYCLEYSFRKEDYDSLPENEKESWLEENLKMAIFEYGSGRNFPWMV
jgi:hypothetical protein